MSDREKWNERYAAENQVALEAPDAIVIEAAGQRAPGRALDVACGSGRNAIYLARAAWSVVAVDISDVALETLRLRAGPDVRIDTQRADLTSPDFELPRESFDLICNCRYLQRDLFPRMISALSAGGILVACIAMQDNDASVKPMNPAFLLDVGELRDLTRGLRLMKYKEDKPAPGVRRMAECIAVRESAAADDGPNVR